MATVQPISTDKLNDPSHSKLHRVIASDSEAADESLVVDASGNVNIKTGKQYQVNGVNILDGKLSLDQTTPQTAVGRFTFPALTADTNTLYVDEVNHRAGIGTTSPGAKLDINGEVLLSYGTQDFLFTANGVYGGNLILQGQSAGTNAFLQLFTKDGDGSDSLGIDVYNVGTPASSTNTERLTIGWQHGNNQYVICSVKSGSGSLRPIVLMADDTTSQLYLATDGNIGIGTTSPTAHLHLKAGTATANTAPIKLTAGVNNTTPEAGTIEFDGTDLFITI